jgi:hypothetical protein
MTEIIPYDDIKKALGLRPKCRVSTVERELRKRGLPFEYGKNCVFTTKDAWNAKIMGITFEKNEPKIELI